VRTRALVPVLCLLLLAGLSGLWVEHVRERTGIVPSPGRVPLGGFEPLAVDLLYLRATDLLNQQRLPEAVTSIRLVTELQPRVAEGWALLGTLLAWRISESSGDPEEEWRFARQGYRVILRGLEHNPDSYHLTFALAQLAWMRLAVDPELVPLVERDLGLTPARIARKAFRRLLEVDPEAPPGPGIAGEAETGRLLGLRLLERGEREEAKKALRASLGLFRGIAADPEATEAQRRVEEIRELLRDL
jgi:hypothetical protein